MFPMPPLEIRKVDETIVTTMSGSIQQPQCVRLIRIEQARKILERRGCVTPEVQSAVDDAPALRASLLGDPGSATPEAIRNCDELLKAYERLLQLQQPHAS